VIVARAGIGLHQLDAIAKRIVNIATVVSFERFILDNAIASGLQSCNELPEVADDESRMSFPCGLEIGFHAQMNLQGTLFEPTSATPGEMGRFGHLTDTEDASIESACFLFPSRRHRELHMIKAVDRHGSGFLRRNSELLYDLGEPASTAL
jgi:hypothetical protein